MDANPFYFISSAIDYFIPILPFEHSWSIGAVVCEMSMQK